MSYFSEKYLFKVENSSAIKYYPGTSVFPLFSPHWVPSSPITAPASSVSGGPDMTTQALTWLSECVALPFIWTSVGAEVWHTFLI